jgi:glycosyltransferase involved in cell wall biosynthesis
MVALIHHPLACETGLSPELKRHFDDAEQQAFEAVDRIFVTSQWTLRRLIDKGVEPERICAIPPGTDPAPLAQGSGGGCLNLLCVGTLTPRKGHAVLLDALAQLRDRSWQLYCAGSLDRDPATANAVKDRIARLALTGRVTLLGEVADDVLYELYAQTDIFVLATHMEGYGMALTEALARGLPVVSTTAGAVPETVPGDAGTLVPPGDSRALADALAGLMDDRTALEELSRGARRARDTLPTWEQASVRFATELDRLA